MQELCQLEGHDGCVWHGAWAPTGNALATCGEDKIVRVWCPQSPQASSIKGPWSLSATLEETQTGTIRSCEFSPCGRFLACGSFDATVAVWELQDGDWECIANLEGHDNEVKSVAWSPSGDLLATCSRDKSVWIWTTSQGVDSGDGGGGRDPDGDGDDDQWECLAVLNGHAQDVKFIQWHPHEKLLFSASYDDTIRVWSDDLDDWLCVATLAGHKSTVWGLAFDKSGERFASCSQDGSVKIWSRQGDAGAWVETASLPGVHDKQPVYSVHWSETGVIVTGGGDNHVCMIEEEKGEGQEEGVWRVTDRFEAHSGDVSCVRWHPKTEGMLVSTSDEGEVKLWTNTTDQKTATPTDTCAGRE